MARMMKESGVAWIGDIPSHWEVRKVKHYYKLQTGFTPDTKNENYYDDDTGYDWVNISDLIDGKTITSTKKKISQAYVDEYEPTQVPKDSLLYSFKLSVGQTAFAGKELYTNEAIAAFVPTDRVDLHFLRYSSVFIAENAEINIYNARILNRDRINNAFIVFPPLEEQRTIAEYLDKECAHIDGVIEKTRASIEEYKKLKQSIITQAVTKGIRPDREMKDSGIEWIGDIPVEWDMVKLKYLFSSDKVHLRVGPFGSALSGVDFIPDGMWVYNQRVVLDNNFEDNDTCISAEKYEELRGFEVLPNDILITTRGTIGRIAIAPQTAKKGILHPCVIKFRVDQERISHNLLLNIFNNTDIATRQIKDMSNSTTIEVLYSYSLKEIQLPYIPKSEWGEIEEFVKSASDKYDDLISSKMELLIELEKYKQSLIFEYVTGKKEVPA